MKNFLMCFLVTALISEQNIFSQNLGGPDKKNVLVWESYAIQPRLSPQFYKKEGSTQGQARLGITADSHKNLHGKWETIVNVKGGKYYAFSIIKRIENIPVADIRRNTPVNIHWMNDEDKTVLHDRNYIYKRLGLENFKEPDALRPWTARMEIPIKEDYLDNGRILVSAVFQAPPLATQARVNLHMRWSENATVEWSDFKLEEISEPEVKKVKLASVYLPGNAHPRVKTTEEAARIFIPYIQEAKAKGADFICLPEVLVKTFTGFSSDEAAEPIPGGAATHVFIKMAVENDIYIVAGMVERDSDALYNTALLVGPEGYIGKYRKTCLTVNEANFDGLSPGREYPVYETRIGKIGMMICFDLNFPEVAANLRRNGAEIIALPIAGGNPKLAQARAIENQIYLVTSTYSGERKDWIKTGIYDYDGTMLDFTEKIGNIAIAEVIISELPRYWGHQGHLKGNITTQAPF